VSLVPYASVLAGDLVLATDRFMLKPLTRDDAADFLDHLADPAVVEFMDIEPLVHTTQALDVIAWTQGIRTRGTGVRWAIRERDGQAFVGTAGFNALVWDRGCRGEVAYDVGRRFWGRRVMDEVLPVLMGFGFGALGLRRIEAMVTAGNEPSCRLLERHGFTREGVLRDHAFWKDRFWDQVVYARLG
jgi:ribosomal-protein-alanine N-acetyltransferase